MNLPSDIPSLEAELRRVIRMEQEDKKDLHSSRTPHVHRIFLRSTQRLRRDIEERLQSARAAAVN